MLLLSFLFSVNCCFKRFESRIQISKITGADFSLGPISVDRGCKFLFPAGFVFAPHSMPLPAAKRPPSYAVKMQYR